MSKSKQEKRRLKQIHRQAAEHFGSNWEMEWTLEEVIDMLKKYARQCAPLPR